MHIAGASDSLLFLRKLVVSLLRHAVPTAILYLRRKFFLLRAFFAAHTTWQEIKRVINQPPEEKRFYDSTIRIIETPFWHGQYARDERIVMISSAYRPRDDRGAYSTEILHPSPVYRS